GGAGRRRYRQLPRRGAGSEDRGSRRADWRQIALLRERGEEGEMRIAMPSLPESLTYSVAASIALAVLAALLLAVTWPGNLIAAVLMLAIALAIYWLVGRNLATIVTAREAAAATAVLFVLCALADLATGYPYQAFLFLLAAAALGYAFMLLQQGTLPVELRFGGVVAVASPSGVIHLRMLEEVHDAGILSSEEFAAKRTLVTL